MCRMRSRPHRIGFRKVSDRPPPLTGTWRRGDGNRESTRMNVNHLFALPSFCQFRNPRSSGKKMEGKNITIEFCLVLGRHRNRSKLRKQRPLCLRISDEGKKMEARIYAPDR